MYRIGVDVGGTFTDVVAVSDDGGVTLAKSPSTPEDQSIGVMAGLERLAARLDTDSGRAVRPDGPHCSRCHGRHQRAAGAQGCERLACSPPKATGTSWRCAKA